MEHIRPFFAPPLFLSCILFLSSCVFPFQSPVKDSAPPETAQEQKKQDCFTHDECTSGVCDHYKAESGTCAPFPCAPGSKSDHNNFFCNQSNKWETSKQEGSSCINDYECYKPTCFMIPSCDLTPIPRTMVSCTNNVCTSTVLQDECERQGLMRSLPKNLFTLQPDGTCMESMEQRILPTICIPCGNGVCDQDLESFCNCPADCKQK